MYRNSFVFIVMLLALVVGVQAQQISVKSFRSLPNDMDARQNYPLKDQNGDLCAIVKVVTSERGFTFDIGSLGITKTEQRTGEIWVYIPYGARRISIFHDKLGVVRDYLFTERIEQGVCYELVLVSGTVVSTVIPSQIETQWLIITTEPVGADVFINDAPAGTTPYQKELPTGKYTLRLAKDLYLPEAAAFELAIGSEKKIFNFALKPNFGTINLSTTPESGATVSLNGMSTGKTTPCKLEKVPAGEHKLTFSLSQYATATRLVNMRAGEEQTLSVPLDASFSEVEIHTNPPATIFVNNEQKATGTWKGRLNPGVYTFEARKDRHAPDMKKEVVEAGTPLTFSLHPTPITGTLKIVTDPYNATVHLDGEGKGQTPLTLRNLLIGEYNLDITKEGFNPLSKTVVVKENQETVVEENLSNYRKVTLSSTPSGANLEVDGKASGTTPRSLTLDYGKHEVKLQKAGYQPFTGQCNITPGQEDYHFQMVSDQAALSQVHFKKYRKRKIITFAAGTLFTGVGTYFLLQSKKHADEYPTATTNATEVYDSMEREQLLAGISFGLGAACYTTSVVYAIKQKRARGKMQVALAPLPGGGLVSVNINF